MFFYEKSDRSIGKIQTGKGSRIATNPFRLTSTNLFFLNNNPLECIIQ